MKLGVFLPSWIGDVCQATPMLRSLRIGLGPNAKIYAFGQRGALEVLEGLSWFDQTMTYERRPLLTHRSRWDLAREIRKLRLDATILLPNSLSSAIVAFMSKVPRRIGYDRDGRGLLLTDRIPMKWIGNRLMPISTIDYYLAFARFLGCPHEDQRMELKVLANERLTADHLWRQCRFREDQPTVVINSSGAFGQSKLWPQAHVELLAKRIANETESQVLIHCGPMEATEANEVETNCKHERIKSMGRFKELPLGLTKAVMERASVVVTTDSGPRHIAAALDRPIVSLFGPTDPMWTTTYNSSETIHYQRMICQPCYQKSCPLIHHACMKRISVDQVFRSVNQVLIRESLGEQQLPARAA